MTGPSASFKLARALVYASVLGSSLTATPAWVQSMHALELVQTIPLPDVHGRIDHLDIDLDGERLFVAALGNDSVEVIDLRAGRRSARLEELQEPQGVAYVSETKRLFVANGRSGRVDVFSGSGLRAASHVGGLEDADNVRYDRGRGQIYVGYGAAVAVIDAATSKLVHRIMLAGHPESFQLEGATPRMFVNVPNAGNIAVVDRSNRSSLAAWSVGDAKANFPMALDEPDHRLFVGTRRPAALLVYDTETGRQVANLPIGGDADDLFYDAERKRIYAICGEGVVDVVQQRDGDHYQTVDQVTTSPGARTGLFAASRNALYIALPAREASPAAVRVYAVR